MIIAYGIFIITFILSLANIIVIVKFIFTDKLNNEKEIYKDFVKPFLIFFLVCLCSAQYIWG